MRLLSLTQPWASLMRSGYKRIESRAWATGYRGKVLLHAAQGFPDYARELCGEERFSARLRATPAALPRGAALAVAELVDCQRITPATLAEWTLSADELAFGDWTPGRYAWWFSDLRPLREPLSLRGTPGLMPITAETLERVQALLQ